MNSKHEPRPAPKSFWKNPFVIIALLGVAYWVYTYHLEHALGFLPYAILLLCPLMHIFMHKNHGGHGGGGNHEDHGHSGHGHEDKKDSQSGGKKCH